MSKLIHMDQVATIGPAKTRKPPTTALDWDKGIHMVRRRPFADGVAQPGCQQVVLAEDATAVRNLQRLRHWLGYRVFSPIFQGFWLPGMVWAPVAVHDSPASQTRGELPGEAEGQRGLRILPQITW